MNTNAVTIPAFPEDFFAMVIQMIVRIMVMKVMIFVAVMKVVFKASIFLYNN